MECYYVELVRMKIGTLKMESVEEEARLFSTMEAAQAWLQNNGFVYGQRSFFNYPEGVKGKTAQGMAAGIFQRNSRR